MNRQAQVGKRAPGFAMRAVDGSGLDIGMVHLDDFLDRWLVLLFYPRDFSMV